MECDWYIERFDRVTEMDNKSVSLHFDHFPAYLEISEHLNSKQIIAIFD